MRVNLRANWSLLERTGTSTNVCSKIAYEFARRHVAAASTVRFAAGAGYVATELVKEVPYYLGAFGAALVSDDIDSVDAVVFLAGTNLGAAAYELVVAALTGAVLARRAVGEPRRDPGLAR